MKNIFSYSLGVCSIKMDVVLIIDNSGSIETRGGEGYFDQIKMFIKNIMKVGIGHIVYRYSDFFI